MSFVGMRQHQSAAVMNRNHNGEMTAYGWFFSFSIAATLSFIAKYWWGNLFRHRNGTTAANKKRVERRQEEQEQQQQQQQEQQEKEQQQENDKDPPKQTSRSLDLSKSIIQEDESTTPTTPQPSPPPSPPPPTTSNNKPSDALTVEIPQHGDLEALFQQAAQTIRGTHMTVATADKLMLYGLYKQGTQGNAPLVNWSLSFQDQSKHHAWVQYKNLPRNVAMLLYVEKANALLQNNGSSNAGESTGGMGAGVSSRPAVPDSVKREDMSLQEQLIAAAGENDVQAIAALLARGVSVDARDDGGQTPLHMAADAGAVEALNYLLDRGASPAAADQYGISVLQAAVIAGHVKICKILMDQGADPDQQDHDGDTPRNCAVDDGSAEMRQIFRLGGGDRIVEGDEEEEEEESEDTNHNNSQSHAAGRDDEESDYWQKTAVSWDTEEGSMMAPGKNFVMDKLPSES